MNLELMNDYIKYARKNNFSDDDIIKMKDFNKFMAIRLKMYNDILTDGVVRDIYIRKTKEALQ